MTKEKSTSELQWNHSLVAVEADSSDTVVTMDSPQKLDDTCEQLFTQLKEARKDVGRPEDLRVNYQIFCRP